MRKLDETNILILLYEYETVWLKEKSTGKLLFEYNFYGDPKCGLIDSNNKWAIVGGDNLIVWMSTCISLIDNNFIKDISSVRYKIDDIIEVLIDPWSELSAIWELNINTLQVMKVRDFLEYREKKYTDNIKW